MGKLSKERKKLVSVTHNNCLEVKRKKVVIKYNSKAFNPFVLVHCVLEF